MQKLLLVYYHSENPKSRHKPNLENTSKYGFSPDLGGKNGGVLSMRMQVILDSSFARPGSAPIWNGKKGEFRDWTNGTPPWTRSMDRVHQNMDQVHGPGPPKYEPGPWTPYFYYP